MKYGNKKTRNRYNKNNSVLPISNQTNLIILHVFRDLGRRREEIKIILEEKLSQGNQTLFSLEIKNLNSKKPLQCVLGVRI